MMNRVTDARGEPYANAVVNLIEPKPGGDVPTLKTAVTDDLGERGQNGQYDDWYGHRTVSSARAELESPRARALLDDQRRLALNDYIMRYWIRKMPIHT